MASLYLVILLQLRAMTAANSIIDSTIVRTGPGSTDEGRGGRFEIAFTLKLNISVPPPYPTGWVVTLVVNYQVKTVVVCMNEVTKCLCHHQNKRLSVMRVGYIPSSCVMIGRTN